jgi:hypothetical protein
VFSIADELLVVSTHEGQLFSRTPTSDFLVRSAEEHAAFKKCVADQEPIYVPGRMATSGTKPRSDPMLTGGLKDGVDYATQSIIAVGGKQCNIERAELSADGSVVTVFCKSDSSQTHGREYSAVVVEPAIPTSVTRIETEMIGGGSPTMVMQSAMMDMPLGLAMGSGGPVMQSAMMEMPLQLELDAEAPGPAPTDDAGASAAGAVE